MSDQHSAFVGSVPENYDRYLGPALFDPFAADIVERLHVPASASVLELACGTGIVTRRLRDRLPPGTRLIATDLNGPMLDYAARTFGSDEGVEWKLADAAALPFAEKSFDAVVCQFGLMFVQDKGRAMREVYRVLKPGGTFLFSVWDEITQNDLAHIAHTTIATFFDSDPPNFYEIPFCLCDPDVVRSLLAAAGFRDITSSLVALPCVSPSALEAARGLIEGNPVVAVINERSPSDLPRIIDSVAAAIVARCGDKPVQGRMQAFVWTALRGI